MKLIGERNGEAVNYEAIFARARQQENAQCEVYYFICISAINEKGLVASANP